MSIQMWDVDGKDSLLIRLPSCFPSIYSRSLVWSVLSRLPLLFPRFSLASEKALSQFALTPAFSGPQRRENGVT